MLTSSFFFFFGKGEGRPHAIEPPAPHLFFFNGPADYSIFLPFWSIWVNWIFGDQILNIYKILFIKKLTWDGRGKYIIKFKKNGV